MNLVFDSFRLQMELSPSHHTTMAGIGQRLLAIICLPQLLVVNCRDTHSMKQPHHGDVFNNGNGAARPCNKRLWAVSKLFERYSWCIDLSASPKIRQLQQTEKQQCYTRQAKLVFFSRFLCKIDAWMESSTWSTTLEWDHYCRSKRHSVSTSWEPMVAKRYALAEHHSGYVSSRTFRNSHRVDRASTEAYADRTFNRV